MTMTAEQRQVDLVDRLAAEARRRVPADQAESVEHFVRRYFAHVAPDDVIYTTFDTLLGGALSLWELGAQRTPGTPKIRLFNPTVEKNGWGLEHTVIEIVNDDMPFLVDSVSAEIQRRERKIHLLLHPVIRTVRDASGNRIEVTDTLHAPADAIVESYMHVEIDQETEPAELESIRASIENILRAGAPRRRATGARCARACRKTSPSSRPRSCRCPPRKWTRRGSSSAGSTTATSSSSAIAATRSTRATARTTSSRVAGDRPRHPQRDPPRVRRARRARPLSPEFSAYARSKDLIIITKANSRSVIHRPVPMDRIGIKRYDDAGQPDRRGPLPRPLHLRRVQPQRRDIPMLRLKAKRTLDRAGLDPHSHNGKALVDILETFPRDEFFQITDAELFDIARGILLLQERQRVALFTRKDVFERFVACYVFVPRDRYTPEFKERAKAVLEEAFNGRDTQVYDHVTTSALARGLFIVRTTPGQIPDVDIRRVEAHHRRGRAHVERSPARRARPRRRARKSASTSITATRKRSRWRTRSASPPTPRCTTSATSSTCWRRASWSSISTATAATSASSTARSFTPARPCRSPRSCRASRTWASRCWPKCRTKCSRSARRMPVRIRDFSLDARRDAGRPHAGQGEVPGRVHPRLDAPGRERRLQSPRPRRGARVARGGRPARVREVPAPGRRRRSARRYIQQTLAQASGDHAQHHRSSSRTTSIPSIGDVGMGRKGAALGIRSQIEDALEQRHESGRRPHPPPLRQPHRGHAAHELLPARRGRASASSTSPSSSTRSTVPELPLPRPMFEIFVYAPWMEGIHLRGGKVARGGIRWSDRREDFRTEILGLMKAQMVKNVVIVPVGSKGGFVVKNPSADRATFQQEGIESYKTLLRGMLDITDNLRGDEVVPPRDVVRRDADDPYLVVAADKGTATFSDIANAISAEYGFWLGDAFASGGSAGYDHKGMGITARGGWEAVKRHFRELGVDTQSEDFTVVGVGDMSGDVFGNAMLLSPHIRLLAAFNHSHIFVDPNPDPARSFAERQRMFDNRLNWNGYNPELLSPGGAVFERSAKTITVSDEVQELFELPKKTVTPAELMRAILLARADLLWLGGIGTYVKASVGRSRRRARPRERRDPRRTATSCACAWSARARTSASRSAAASSTRSRGGKINTDAIDNSAGVDTSDHEVNIKIALYDAHRARRARRASRSATASSPR